MGALVSKDTLLENKESWCSNKMKWKENMIGAVEIVY
jgi:hypothetical protein